MNAILRSRILWLALITSLNPISSALAKKSVDLHLLDGVSLGYSNFEFPVKLDQTLTFAVYQINAAVAYKKFYAVVNLADSLSSADVSEEEDVGSATRYDRDLTLGYQMTDNWGVFVGYKTGETEIDYLNRVELDLGGPVSPREESYLQKGPFIGVSYSKKFSLAGKLSLTLAYADLNATNTFTRDVDPPDPGEIPEFDDLAGTARGKVRGLSYGIRWSIPVSGNLLYYVSYKINDYQQDLSFGGNQFNDIDQTLSYFTTSVVYVF